MQVITIRLLHDQSTRSLAIEVNGKRVRKAGVAQAGMGRIKAGGAMRRVRRAMAEMEKSAAKQSRGLFLVQKS